MKKFLTFDNEKRLALIFFATALLWLLSTNLLLELLVSGPALLSSLKSYNSWLFVLLATAAFYFVAVQFRQKLQQKEDHFSELQEKEKQLREESHEVQEKLMWMLKKAPSPMAILIGEKHEYNFVNDAYLKMFGNKKLVGKTVKEVFPEVEEQGLIDKLDEVFATGKKYYKKGEPLKVSLGVGFKTYYRDIIYSPLFDETGETYGIFIQSNDITPQVEAKQELEKAFQEKKGLIKELHHRVKDNLSVIEESLELQAGMTENSALRLSINNIRSRIYAIAKIHELVFQQQHKKELPFHDFVNSLLARAFKTLPELYLYISSLTINKNKAISLGLILNEIFSSLANTQSQEIKKLTIRTDSLENNIHIDIKISGVKPGFIQTFSSGGKSFERTFLNQLLEQLQGSLSSSFTGTSSELNLRFAKNEEEASLIKEV